nr:ER membrane protein complex subunit 1-like [Ipomoea batatas]
MLFQAPMGSLDIQHIVHPEGTDDVYAVGLTSSSQFVAYKINARKGELLKHERMVFPGGFSGDISLVTSEKVVALDSTGVTYEGKLEVVDKVAYGAVISESLSLSEGNQAFGLIKHGVGKIHLSVKSINDWGSNLLEESSAIDSQKGLVHKVFINSYIRTDRSYGFRALIVLEDHSLLLLQQGEVVWSREDGLASIVDVTTSELPIEKDGVSVSKVEQNLFEWLKGHLLKLKGTLMLATPDDVAAIQQMRLKSSGKSKMTRDHNGFRKLLIVLSRSGKLYALHTGDGRIVWSFLVNALRKSETCENPNGLKIHQWQVPHHHAMDENPSVLVVGKCGLNSDAPSVLSFVDSYTGKELKILKHVHSIAQVVHTQAKVTTDRDVMYKYISKNMLFVATVAPKAASDIGSVIPDESWLIVYLIDTVTGRILHRMTHQGSQGPVHAAEGLRGIVTVPAKLESTTLVFAYGVDLFFTQLAPSKTYDSLTDDFSYALLLLTIVALVVAIFITWIWSEQKELQEKWRIRLYFALAELLRERMM